MASRHRTKQLALVRDSSGAPACKLTLIPTATDRVLNYAPGGATPTLNNVTISNGAFVFNGASGTNIKLTPIPDLGNGDFTVIIIAKPTAVDAADQLIENGGESGSNIGWRLHIASSVMLYFYLSDGIGLETLSLAVPSLANNLGCFSFGRIGTQRFIGYNGSFATGVTALGTNTSNSNTAKGIFIGSFSNGAYNFQGNIYAAYAFNRGLSQTEINSIRTQLIGR